MTKFSHKIKARCEDGKIRIVNVCENDANKGVSWIKLPHEAKQKAVTGLIHLVGDEFHFESTRYIWRAHAYRRLND